MYTTGKRHRVRACRRLPQCRGARGWPTSTHTTTHIRSNGRATTVCTRATQRPPTTRHMNAQQGDRSIDRAELHVPTARPGTPPLEPPYAPRPRMAAAHTSHPCYTLGRSHPFAALQTHPPVDCRRGRRSARARGVVHRPHGPFGSRLARHKTSRFYGYAVCTSPPYPNSRPLQVTHTPHIA